MSDEEKFPVGSCVWVDPEKTIKGIVQSKSGNNAILRNCLTRQIIKGNVSDFSIATPPEHIFDVKRQEWERAVVINASKYRVMLGMPVDRNNKEFDNLEDALAFSKTQPRSNIYAETASGRGTHISEKEAEEYIAEINRLKSEWTK
jgi:hypothetical protein